MPKKSISLILFVFLALSSATIFSLQKFSGNHFLQVSFLNIGQGDAIFIETPNGTQILVDAGGGNQILGELGRVMSPFDKHIDAIMITNPDKDHIGGFIPVLERFEVDKVFYPGTINPTPTSQTLQESIKKEGAENILARRGQRIMLDEEAGVYIDILFPDKDVSNLSSNDGSIVAKLHYGKTSVLLQGDAPAEVERYLLSIKENTEELKTDILKVGHHGSRTSTVLSYVTEASPKFAVISCGKDNRYGHPHKEVLQTLQEAGVPALRTDVEGRIVFLSNGESIWRKEGFFK